VTAGGARPGHHTPKSHTDRGMTCLPYTKIRGQANKVGWGSAQTGRNSVKIAPRSGFQQKVTVIPRSQPLHAAHRHEIPARVTVQQGQEEYGAQVFITGA
jgi:hypothetical protein